MKDNKNSFTVHAIKALREAVNLHWSKKEDEKLQYRKVARYTNLMFPCDAFLWSGFLRDETSGRWVLKDFLGNNGNFLQCSMEEKSPSCVTDRFKNIPKVSLEVHFCNGFSGKSCFRDWFWWPSCFVEASGGIVLDLQNCFIWLWLYLNKPECPWHIC